MRVIWTTYRTVALATEVVVAASDNPQRLLIKKGRKNLESTRKQSVCVCMYCWVVQLLYPHGTMPASTTSIEAEGRSALRGTWVERAGWQTLQDKEVTTPRVHRQQNPRPLWGP